MSSALRKNSGGTTTTAAAAAAAAAHQSWREPASCSKFRYAVYAAYDGEIDEADAQNPRDSGSREGGSSAVLSVKAPID